MPAKPPSLQREKLITEWRPG